MSPVKIKKTNGYQVSHGGAVSAKNTTLEKAKAQGALLEGIRHGWKPTGKPARYKKKKKTAREKYANLLKRS